MITVKETHRKWWALVATSSSLAMIFLDQSALPVALPSIQRDFNLSASALQWTINAYLLTLAVLIILGGKLGDKFGHRRMFMGGMIVFIASSVLCAAAPDSGWLIAARALQGVGGAFMMPSAGPLLRTILTGEEFGKMIGLYVAIASVFLILGPALGGIFATYLSWRWIFWINFPVALISILITYLVIPSDSKKISGEGNFDWLGFLTSSLCLMTLVYALMEGQSLGWRSPIVLSCFGASLLSFVIFMYNAKRHPVPFVDLSIFKDPYLSRGVMVIVVTQIAYISVIFWAMFLQYTLSLSPARTGVFLLSAQIPVIFMSPIAGKLLGRFGPRLPVRIGTAVLTMSCFWMAIFASKHEFVWIVPALVMFGIGSPLISISIMSSVVSASPPEKRGVASGVISAARQVGSSVGLAVLAAVSIHINAQSIENWLKTAGSAFRNITELQIHTLLMGTPLPPDVSLTPAQIEIVHAAAVQSYTAGFSTVMWIVGAFTLLGFWVARKLPSGAIKTL